MDFDSQDFLIHYTYSKDDLGSYTDGQYTSFRVWAPTAKSVVLNLFEDGRDSPSFASYKMKKSVKGTWSKKVKCTHGTYYTYSIDGPEGLLEAVDPYAKAGGVNGKRGMVVDLEKTNPKGFENDTFVKCHTYSDAVIWEVHVRDFSNKIKTSKYPGKYLAFTETGLKNEYGISVGIDYLKTLGITHVQLQPVFDYGSGDESNPDTWFNWGYDPANYNFPEGSYSTDPSNGEVRIREFKQMVQSLHNAGIGVIMDVVYNHTFFTTSNLWKTCPYYYYRYKGWQQFSNGSGCGNETASERPMFRKYMIDSIKYWQTEYHIDGFRFDLMALHDIKTMQCIEKAVHKINPDALIYGEPWAGGDSSLPYHMRATRENLGLKSKIYVFNDTIRDGLKGNSFNVHERGYINGCVNGDTAGRVSYGIGAVNFINYMSCHDNFTLWDKLCISTPEATLDDHLAMNRLGISILFISRSVPLMLAGEEMLRSKKGDGNSYMSSDEINNLNWSSLARGSYSLKMKNYYAKLIKMRKENSFLIHSDVTFSILENGVIRILYSKNDRIMGYAVINPNNEPFSCPKLPEGNWSVVFNGEKFSKRTNRLKFKASVYPKSVLLVKRV